MKYHLKEHMYIIGMCVCVTLLYNIQFGTKIHLSSTHMRVIALLSITANTCKSYRDHSDIPQVLLSLIGLIIFDINGIRAVWSVVVYHIQQRWSRFQMYHLSLGATRFPSQSIKYCFIWTSNLLIILPAGGF